MPHNDRVYPYKITVLKMGECEVPGPEVYWMSNWDTWEKLFFWMVLIQNERDTLIINTGPPADLTALNECWSKAVSPRSQMVRIEAEKPLNALRTAGVSPEQVGHVILTPLQAYTTGNVPLFVNAKVYISRRGWIEDFHAPQYEMHIPRKLRIPDDVLYYLDIKAPDKLHLVGDEEEILPGISVFWAGVHHRSSMAVCIQTKRGKVIVSDAFFKFANIEQDQPLGVGESLEECRRTYARIRKDANLLLPLYDPDVLNRFPGGVIE